MSYNHHLTHFFSASIFLGSNIISILVTFQHETSSLVWIFASVFGFFQLSFHIMLLITFCNRFIYACLYSLNLTLLPHCACDTHS
ncbi:hypothetical protein BJ165DRAFT_1511610 [Panaeolus papilionaceus]|nr:hypothetical protein BJ165DRAFT_1511610 [Panaeolus papilionaceus]